MNTKQIEKILTDSGIEHNEAMVESKMLIKHFLGFTDIDIALGKEFDSDIVFQKAIERAEAKKPIQHVIGTAYFMGDDFIVNENVLIPRDETEILVRAAIEKICEHGFKSVLDIGTGSGCIACSIAKNTEAQVLGVDISSDALMVALENATKLGLNNKAIFRKSDLFEKIHRDEKFDLIVSNPPYIPISQKGMLQKEVEFDPSLALFAQDEQGVNFYKLISECAPKFLKKGGYLMFELGINQSTLVRDFMRDSGFESIEIIGDLAGIDRVILGKIS